MAGQRAHVALRGDVHGEARRARPARPAAARPAGPPRARRRPPAAPPRAAASSWHRPRGRPASPSPRRLRAAGPAARPSWPRRPASCASRCRGGGGSCRSRCRAHRAARHPAGAGGRHSSASATTTSASSRSRARLSRSRSARFGEISTRRDLGAPDAKLRGLAAWRGAEIGHLSTGEVAQKAHRQGGRRILDPPGALAVARQLLDRAADGAPHRMVEDFHRIEPLLPTARRPAGRSGRAAARPDAPPRSPWCAPRRRPRARTPRASPAC